MDRVVGQLVILPSLHGSGFGNQIGMLLLHIALAALTGRTLVLPRFHQPTQHRSKQSNPNDDGGLSANDALNLTAFAPLARVIPRRTAAYDIGLLTYSAGDTTGRRPLKLPPSPLPPLLAAAKLLRSNSVCEEGVGAGGRCGVRDIVYCHLPKCRDRTKRACKKLDGGCARTSQRLPNNYLFAHRLPSLVCEENATNILELAGGLASDTESQGTLTQLARHQRSALKLLTLSDSLKATAAAFAKQLGPYAAIHARLPDVADSSMVEAEAYNKGVDPKELPKLIQSLLARRKLPPSLPSAAGEWTLYVASNRPSAVKALLPKIASAVASAGLATNVRIKCWHDLLAKEDGLRAALIEHELCVNAPLGFAGSPFSTWANLIGARRVANGGRPYVDLQSGALVPACAAASSASGL